MALNYNHLFYFHVAALEGSVAAAAQRLGVTAATVSEQLRTLERSLGKDLFERTQSGLRLTDAGRVTFEHTIPMFRLGDRLQQHFGDGKEKTLPVLRVGLSIAVSRTMTVAVVAPLFTLDKIAPSIRTGEHVELLRDLKSGGLDLMLSESSPEDSATRGLTATEIQRVELVAICAPSFTPAVDWSNAALVYYRPTTPFRHDVEQFLAENHLTPKFGGEADDGLLLIEAATQAGCITIVPKALSESAVECNRLKVIRPVSPSTCVIHALYPDTASAKSAVAALQR